MKEGEANNVRIKFTANPKPSAGVWTLGEKTVPVGASDNENTAKSSPITESGVSIIFNILIRKVASTRLVSYYSILESFGQRSQYISIKFTLCK